MFGMFGMFGRFGKFGKFGKFGAVNKKMFYLGFACKKSPIIRKIHFVIYI